MDSQASSAASSDAPLERPASPLVTERHIPPFKRLQELLRAFSPFERLTLYILTALLATSALAILVDLNSAVSTEVPARGGTLVEGAVGTPRFVNPLLAVSQSDQDLTMLMYSGLLRATRDGGFVEDLAEKYEVSDDGTTYTFHIRKDATFHDGSPVTSKDVLFTISRAQNPDTKSQRRADWEGVTVAAPDDYTVSFTLPAAYAPFLENLTMGILPSHLWENVPATEFQFIQLNTKPVGSGPYRIKEIVTDPTGAPTEYTLVPFNDYALGAPYISRIIYKIFPSESALQTAYVEGDIESFVAASPQALPELTSDTNHVRIPLARSFGVFLNQSHAPVLADAAVREAMNAAVDKEAIINDVLGGYGSMLNSPIPPGLLAIDEVVATSTPISAEERAASARAILEKGGWSWNEAESAWEKNKTKLTLTLATSDAEELAATANMVANQWRAAGINVSVQIYPLTEFNQTVLRPRNYDAILFGEVVGRSLDLFAFWHSSQRNDPGLNMSLYTNAKADKALASARAEDNRKVREEYFREFVGYVKEDNPAVFLYSPELAYLVPNHLNGVYVGALTTPAERFASVHRWYRDTERVWNVFASQYPIEL